MIQLDTVTLRRGPEPLFSDASLTIHSGWKVGLTGRNGTGKSSLLALLAGELENDTGTVSVPAEWRLARMAQEVPALEQSALSYVLDGNHALREAEQALAAAEAAGQGDAIAAAHDRLQSLDAWSQPARAATVLAGLGFSEAAQGRPVATFSGGWRMRLSLARVLLADADLLLLDEPTNHLDLDAVLWLQDWLQRCPATLILISHDRAFLDEVVDHIAHIDQHRLSLFSGNYSNFERQRAAQLAQQKALYQKQQVQAAHLQAFVDRFRAKASKARQAQSRLKALAKLEQSAPAHVDDGFSFHFREPARLPNPMVTLDQASCGYAGAGEAILTNVTLGLRPDSRVGLLGPNGAGKSTLVRTLAGELPALAGHQHTNPELVVGYFHQQQVDALDMNATPFQLLQRRQPGWEEVQVRTELGCFGFHGDDVFAPTGRFSGGEKARLALALLVQDRPSLLLLDEPANHLDLDMRESLTLALQAFPGAVVMVSHDRHLLETSVDELLLVANGTVTDWDGDLDDYARWLRQQRSSDTPAGGDSAIPATADARSRRQQAAQRRNQLRPLKQQVARLENGIDALTDQLGAINDQLADETLYQDQQRKDELAALLADQAALKRQLDEHEDALLEAMENLEQAELSLDEEAST